MSYLHRTPRQMFIVAVLVALVALVACSPSSQAASTATTAPTVAPTDDEPTAMATQVVADASTIAAEENNESDEERNTEGEGSTALTAPDAIATPSDDESTVMPTQVVADASSIAAEENSESDEERSTEAEGSAAATCIKLNLNTLTEADLTASIPDFPQDMVSVVLDGQPYTSIQQFRSALGTSVDADQEAAWETYLYVPVDPNKADADTLMQLPGVTKTLANTLISKRPFATNQAFLTTLGKSVTADNAALASCYLAPETQS